MRGLAIWMLFVALDLLTIHDPSIPLFYIRIAGTLSLIPFFLATFLIKPGRWIEVIGFAAVFIQIVLLTALVAFLSPVSLPYYQPTEVWITIGVATFVVCGVSFIDGLILALGTVFGFFLSVTILQPEPLLLIAFDFAWLSAVLTFVELVRTSLIAPSTLLGYRNKNYLKPKIKYEHCYTTSCHPR